MKTLTLCIVLFFGFIATSAYAEDIIGTILEVEGGASVTSVSGQSMPASVNMHVHPHDVITTGPASRVFIQLIDNTELTLAEKARLSIDDFIYDDINTDDNRAAYSILKGAFLYVSGLIAKKPEPDVTVNTAVGAIGIRGTRFWGGPIDGEYGVVVGDGEVELNTGAGKVRLKRGQGTRVKARGLPPSPPQAWAHDKVARAVQTVTLQNLAAIGRRMEEDRKRHPMMVERHKKALIERKEEIKKEKQLREEKKKQEQTPVIDEQRREKLRELREEKAKTLESGNTQVDKSASKEVTPDAKRAIESTTETTRTVTQKSDGGTETTIEKRTETTDKPANTLSDKPSEVIEKLRENAPTTNVQTPNSVSTPSPSPNTGTTTGSRPNAD